MICTCFEIYLKFPSTKPEFEQIVNEILRASNSRKKKGMLTVDGWVVGEEVGQVEGIVVGIVVGLVVGWVVGWVDGHSKKKIISGFSKYSPNALFFGYFFL